MSREEVKQRIERVSRFFAEHPEKAHSKDTPATAVLQEGLRCVVDGADSGTAATDMPKAIGGGASAPSPGWLMRAALASCDATVIAMRAAYLGINLNKLEVTVGSESDDRGLLGMDESISAGPLGLQTTVRLSASGATPEQLREVVEWAEAHSPVGDALRRAIPIEAEVEID